MLTGYHGTQEDFETFLEERFGSEPTRSPNGALGVWVFLDERNAQHIGDRVLRVEADVRNPIRYASQDMLRDHLAANATEDPVGFFRELRTCLLARGHDAIEVAELDGRVGMAVILDLDRIVSVTDLTPLPAGPR